MKEAIDMNNIINCLARSIPLAALIIIVGYLIVFFILKNPQKTDFTLFVLGAIPIVIFLPSVFSQSKSGALHTPKVIFRKVETLEKKRKAKNRRHVSSTQLCSCWHYNLAIQFRNI